jgi:hypothetical protein
MSSLRYRLKQLLPSLSLEANHNQDRQVKIRYYELKAIAGSSKTVKRACESRGVSQDYFELWAGRLLKLKSLVALKNKSKAPKYSPNKISQRTERNIARLKKHIPFQGPERIAQDLKKVYKIICSPSSIYRSLKRQKLISQKKRSYRTKKHIKRYRRPLPGYLQMDIKYVSYLVEENQYYQLSCIDHHSSWRMIRCYRDKSAKSTIKFLMELETICPFAIMQIQTDNGTEFTDRFRINGGGVPSGNHPMDHWCREREIPHKLIPIAQKEINGKIENAHKYDDEEFFSQVRCTSYVALERATRAYSHRWSECRATKTLGWKTPIEVIAESYVRSYAWLCFLREVYSPESKTFGHLGADGSWLVQVPEKFSQPKKLKKKFKKLSAIDRHLAYWDWEKKQRIKSLIPLLLAPAISRNFSQEFGTKSSVLYLFKRRL